MPLWFFKSDGFVVYFCFYDCSCNTAWYSGGDKQAITELTSSANVTSISVESGYELFLRFITLTSLDHPVRNMLHLVLFG